VRAIFHGASLPEKNKLNPLHIAAKSGNLPLVMLFLNRGVDVNVCDNEGWTPLHFAAMSDNNEVVMHLILNGANLEAKTGICEGNPMYNDMTPLDFAKLKGETALIALLSNWAHWRV
jgi:ankyrin repeat protein